MKTIHPAFRTHFAPSMLTWLDNVLDNSLAKDYNVAAQVPAMNIKETEIGYDVELMMPGMKKENIKIEVEKNILTVSAKNETTEESKEDGKYTRKEFHSTAYSRSLTLSESIDAQNINANYTDGILTIKLTRKVPEVKAARTIAVE